MNRYVIDASVAAKWFLSPPDETLVDEADRLLRLYTKAEVQFFVPDLFFAEFANIFWKAERLNRCDRQTADRAIAEVLDRNFPCFPSRLLLKSAAALARDHGRTVYDSLYLALAAALEASLVTADEKLANSLRGRLPVLWLGAF
ncbi:MAG TPA: type II toxin-antitoxin system VapC family toxin [Bryobacterales bacterium]|nr:type II toxin-antitoxin system VapC family toxin [Bryobacterales bacterium]